MYKLYGVIHHYNPNAYTGEPGEEIHRELVATFDTKIAADEYITKAKLKHPIKDVWSSGRSFRRKSLLAPYTYAEIEAEIEEAFPPHNPEIA